MTRYCIITRYTVRETFYVEASSEKEARRIALSNDIQPASSEKKPIMVVGAWPTAKGNNK